MKCSVNSTDNQAMRAAGKGGLSTEWQAAGGSQKEKHHYKCVKHWTMPELGLQACNRLQEQSEEQFPPASNVF